MLLQPPQLRVGIQQPLRQLRQQHVGREGPGFSGQERVIRLAPRALGRQLRSGRGVVRGARRHLAGFFLAQGGEAWQAEAVPTGQRDGLMQEGAAPWAAQELDQGQHGSAVPSARLSLWGAGQAQVPGTTWDDSQNPRQSSPLLCVICYMLSVRLIMATQ